MEYNSKGERLVSIVRVIEYRGTDTWIRAVMDASRVPFQGEFQAKNAKGEVIPLPEGHSIKSGLVNWSIVEEAGEEGKIIPVPPSSGTGRVM